MLQLRHVLDDPEHVAHVLEHARHVLLLDAYVPDGHVETHAPL